MNEKPILFNTDMACAILEERKTVTRRAVKGYALDHLELDTDGSIIGVYQQDEGRVFPIMDFAPYRPGDVLYVRETWVPWSRTEGIVPKIHYKADGETLPGVKWKPSIHMPREAARIFLRVTSVSVERLQDITDSDLMRDFDFCLEAIKAVGRDALAGPFWNSTIKPADRALYGWDANPWVWVIEFQRVSRKEAMRR